MADPDGPQIDPDAWDPDLFSAWVLPHVISVGTFVKELAEAVNDAPEVLAIAVANLPPPPDPRSPLEILLSSFALEDEREARPLVAAWNAVEQAANEAATAAQPAVEAAQANVQASSASGTAEGNVLEAVLAAASAALGAVAKATDKKDTASDAQIHVSDAADLFPRWHIKGGKLDEDFELPLVVPLAEEPVKDGVTRADLIKKAREMIPKIPIERSGKALAGKLCWVKYGPRKTEGWVYTDPDGSDYVQALNQVLKRTYDDAKKAADARAADPKAQPPEKLSARAAQWKAAACIAVKAQEGTPSAINAYDGLVLTWGIGIAGPGKLPRTFWEITRDMNVWKALYLCGFHYQGTIVGNEHHGGYQIVDLDKKQIVFRDNFYHQDAPAGSGKSYKKGSHEGNAYKALKLMTDQPEMMMLLIQLAKDPVTAPTIFAPNYRMIQAFVTLTNVDQIHSEALYVFAGQVRHNWGLGQDIIKWAVDHFGPSDPPKIGPPSPERDAAIAKGICRLVMSRIQQQKWKNAVRDLKKGAPEPTIEATFANIEFELTRLRKNYLAALKTGANTQDASRVDLGGFLETPMTGPAPVGHYACADFRNDKPTPRRYDLGPVAQCDLLFPSDKITLLRFDSGNIVIKDDTGAVRTVTQEGKPVP